MEAEDGTRYLDFTAGIGVNALGYKHPVVTGAIAEAAAAGMLHTSNLFRTRPGEELAELLVQLSCASKAFFCNSGAEANEAALKFARRTVGGGERVEIVAFGGSFHGRTIGTLATTDRPAFRAPFEPLMPGVRFLDPGDTAALRHIHSDRTAAVIVEPVQGEGGVRPVDPAFLREVRRRCDETGAVLIFDEVQCGLGRTGSFFAYEQTGVEPDIVTLAKPLAAGLPMGAALVNQRVASAVRVGDHATTFGGGPFVAAVALATVRVLSDSAFLGAVRRHGELVGRRLTEAQRTRPGIREVRGRGLMWGVELDVQAGPVIDQAFNAGLLVLPAGPNVIRLLPPLIVDTAELEQGLDILVSLL